MRKWGTNAWNRGWAVWHFQRTFQSLFIPATGILLNLGSWQIERLRSDNVCYSSYTNQFISCTWKMAISLCTFPSRLHSLKEIKRRWMVKWCCRKPSSQRSELSAPLLLMENSADSCHNPDWQLFPRGNQTGSTQEIPVIALFFRCWKHSFYCQSSCERKDQVI